MQKLKEISHVKLLNRQNTDYDKVKIRFPPHLPIQWQSSLPTIWKSIFSCGNPIQETFFWGPPIIDESYNKII